MYAYRLDLNCVDSYLLRSMRPSQLYSHTCYGRV